MNINELIESNNGERTFFDGELIGAYFTVANLEKLCEEYHQHKNAPAIEQGEPVGWTNELQLSYLDDGDACLVYPDTTECPIPVFTSPPQREWVGLTDKRIEEIAKLNGAWQLYSSLKIFDFVANIIDELKQLNTKG